MAKNIDTRIILLITCLASFVTPFLGSSINIALPAIGAEFNADVILLDWVVTSFLLSAAIFIVPFGRLADIYGKRRIFIAGLAVLVLSTLLSVFSGTIFMLITSRVLQGIGSAMLFGTAVAILTSSYPVKERGKVLGINVATVYTGLSLGPFLGGLIVQYAGWRSIFILIALIGIVSLILSVWKLEEDWRNVEAEKFDIIGCVLYAGMLFSTMYGLSLIPAMSGVYWLGAGLAGLAFFIWWEMRHKSPVLKVSIFRNNTVFTFSNLAALINYSATFAIGFLLSLYLQYVRGFDPQTAGLILVAQPVMQAIFSPAAGRLSDRIEPRIVASTGMGMCVIGLGALTFLSASTPLIYLIGCLVFLGLGFALFSSPNTNAVMSSVDKRDYGVASGMLGTMRLIGQMMSLGIAMLVFSIIMGRVMITPEQHELLMSSITTAFIIFAILCVFGLVASMVRGNLREETAPKIPVSVRRES